MIKIYSVLSRCSHVNTASRVKLKRELNLFKKITSNFWPLLFRMASNCYQLFFFWAEGFCERFHLLVFACLKKYAIFLLIYILGSAMVGIIFIHGRAEPRSLELYYWIWLAQLSSLGCDRNQQSCTGEHLWCLDRFLGGCWFVLCLFFFFFKTIAVKVLRFLCPGCWAMTLVRGALPSSCAT